MINTCAFQCVKILLKLHTNNYRTYINIYHNRNANFERGRYNNMGYSRVKFKPFQMMKPQLKTDRHRKNQAKS